MPKATNPLGSLVEIENCYINIPGAGKITMRILPEISDSKSASYNDEPLIGRSFPLKTFSHGENRVISMQLHYVVTSRADILNNLKELRWLESAVYTRDSQSGLPFVPPPVCTVKCGEILAKEDLCVVLKSYDVKFPTNVSWDKDAFNTLCPYQFDVNTQWEVVYMSSQLPGQNRIAQSGR